ncbi:DUF3168 domain-containing protein [Sphingomonas turrisvirgatae]|uniref:DUF3168 domain-containing protein n=1 Tax=Sphingomonas turrisvirgatae TaxID=1888892 RepID=A0A1E3LTC5_9SPHN|nr:DUF3168 domain-containing protein [Sphingomonas turrisvirgatae]ODP37031.1 hypothetical protein BFL28_19120 [Sphingomonas turrisvirgatae]
MSAHIELQAALVAAIASDPVLSDTLTRVFDAPPIRAARPYALVEDAVLTDWSTKDMAGREGRVAVTLFDLGERPVRAQQLAGSTEEAVLAMPAQLGGGWRIISLMLIRSRLVREGEGRWAATSEFRIRMLREG